MNKVQERKKAKQVLNVAKIRAAKSKAQMRYTEVHKEVKRSIRSDKRNYLEQLATEAEEAAGKGNLNELYKITKTLSGKQRQVTTPIKDKEGKVLTNTDDQLKRWAAHFNELLNSSSPQHHPGNLSSRS